MPIGDLTTLADVQAVCGDTVTGIDAKVSLLITACSAWVKSYLNRDILSTAYTETLNGTGGRQIMTANYPVTAITQVLVDNIDVTTYAVADGRRTISLTNLNNSPTGFSFGCPTFRRDIMNVVVKYTAGFATVPADLELTVIRLVQWAIAEMKRPQQNSKSMQGEVITFSTASAPKWALDNLNNLKKVIG